MTFLINIFYTVLQHNFDINLLYTHWWHVVGTEIAHFNELHKADLRFFLPLTTKAQAASKTWFVIEYKKGDRVIYKQQQTLDLCSFEAICI